MENFRFSWLIKTVVWGAAVFFVVWVLNQSLGASGTIIVQCSPTACDQRFKHINPRQGETVVGTTTDSSEKYFLVSADPFTFDVNLLRTFQKATVKMTYLVPESNQRFQIGLVGQGGRYEIQNFADYNRPIDMLLSSWNVTQKDDTVLFQKPDKKVHQFQNLDDFLEHVPNPESIGTYNIDINTLLRVPGYQPAAQTTELSTSIRGQHVLAVYVGSDESLNLTFDVQDINRHAGRDPVTFRVLRGADEIHSVALRDDGNINANGKPSAHRKVRILLPRVSPGVYSVAIDTASDDLFIRTISSQPHLVQFKERLYLAGSPEYKALGDTTSESKTVYFKGKSLRAVTSHSQSLQTLTVGSRSLKLTKVLQPVTINSPSPDRLVPVTIPIQDIDLVVEDGFIALSPDHFFDIPNAPNQRLQTAKDAEKFDYVLALYRRPNFNGKLLTAEQTFDSFLFNRNLHFTVSGSPAFSDQNHELRIINLEVRLEAPALTFNKVKSMLGNFLTRLKKGEAT